MRTKKLLGITMVMILALSLMAGCKSKKTKEDETSTTMAEQDVEGLVADLEKAKNIISDAPGTDEYLTKDEISSRFDKMIEDLQDGKIDREDCYYQIREIVAEIHCVHMGIYTKPNDPLYQECLSMSFMWFGDELRITSSLDENSQYLGMKVKKIAGKSIDDIVSDLSTINPYETQTGAKMYLEQPLWNCDLSYLGLLNDAKDSVSITVEDEDGKETELDVLLKEYSTKRVFLDDIVSSTSKVPFTYQMMVAGRNYSYKADTENNTMYFQYLSCQQMDDESLDDCFGKMVEEIKSNSNIKNLVIDVRWNSGGNRSLMVDTLNKYFNDIKNMNVVMIVGKGTYSSAFQLVGDCMEGFGNIKIYGEETGQALHHYTELSLTDLTALNCNLCVPTAKNEQPILENKYGDVKNGITPDVEVAQTYDDYLNGIDTIYNKIIQDVTK